MQYIKNRITFSRSFFANFLALNCLHLRLTLSSNDSQRKSVAIINKWRFSKRATGLIVFIIIAILLVSTFAFLPKGTENTPTPQSTDTPTTPPTSSPSSTPHKTNTPTVSPNRDPSGPSGVNRDSGFTPTPTPKIPGVLETAQTVNGTVWLAIAANAWKYYQPGVGVDNNTGIPMAALHFPGTTDWDLGVYIQSVIDASKIGLIENNGTWGFNYRIDKVLTYLETRELNTTTNYPFRFYQTTDGTNYKDFSDGALVPIDCVDTGRLFVALNNLRAYNSNFTSRVNNFVYNSNGNRTNYAGLVQGIKSDNMPSLSIYTYYVVSGFAAFWPNELSIVPKTILNNIYSSGNVTANGVILPRAAISGDPLLGSFFELNSTDVRLAALNTQVYLAHEKYNKDTGSYRAFGEGPSLSTNWQWEWVVLPDGRTWTSLTDFDQPVDSSPIIYTKIAFGYLAIFNTTFALQMAIYLEQNLPEPTNGYSDGISESGTPLGAIGTLTNGLILDAAAYVLKQKA